MKGDNMRKNLFKRILLFFIPLTMVLASCNSEANAPHPNANEGLPKISVAQKDFKEIDWDGQELKPVDMDNPDLYNNTFRDVEPNFSFELKGISKVLNDSMLSSINDKVTVADSSSNVVSFGGNLNNSTNRVLIQASSPYEAGKVYTATLHDESLQFVVGNTLHESIRQIIFSVKEEDKNVMSLKEGLRTLPVDNVLSNSTDPLEPHKSLLYKGSVEVSQDEVIKFASDDETRIDDTFYIKVSSFANEDGNTRIYYESPKIDEIMTELDCHVDDKPLVCDKNNFHLSSEEQMYEDLLNSDAVMDYVAYAAYAYNFSNDESAIVDFIKSCTINITFKFIDGGISVQAVLLFKHQFESGWVLALNITLEWQETYRISADAEIEYTLGIPTDVNMSMSSSKTDKFSIKGSIIFSHSTFNPGPDWQEPKDLDLNKAKEAVEQLKNNWSDKGMFDSKRDKTESGVTLFNLGWVDFYFGYVTVSIEFYLYLTSSISISLGFGYTYESTTTLVNFSTGDGNKGGSASPSGVSTNCLDVELVGKYYLEFGLKVRFLVYITGLKWIINLQLDLDAGLYLNITGFGGFVANLVTGDVSLDVGFVVEIGFILRVTLSVVVFGTGYGNWEIWSLKKPLITFGNTNRIEDRVDETVNLKKERTKIDDTNMMKFTVFDGASMLSTVKTLSYKEELTIADSVFWDTPISRKLVVEAKSKNPDYIKIEDDELVIQEDAPKLFDAVIELTVCDVFAAKKHTYDVNVHYQKEGTKIATFDGAGAVAFDKGEEIEFPIATKEGQIFKAWQLNGKDIDLSKPYLMGEEDLNFTSRFISDVTFLVEFYDGHGNLVSSQYVTNEEAATPPEASVRDANMEGYVFVGWDTDISCITQDIKVHGIYVKVSEVE